MLALVLGKQVEETKELTRFMEFSKLRLVFDKAREVGGDEVFEVHLLIMNFHIWLW